MDGSDPDGRKGSNSRKLITLLYSGDSANPVEVHA
jgi:hypothetical protein